jgi:hypothetical protein
MKTFNLSTMKLQKGEIQTYDFGKTKMYAYQTNDSFNDVVFILEKNKNMTAGFFSNKITKKQISM